jgi:hypothetical protein
MNKNQTTAIRKKFQQIDKELSKLTKAISWLSFVSITLNALAKKDHSEEEIADALKEASKQLAKVDAALKGINITSDPERIWERYFGRV